MCPLRPFHETSIFPLVPENEGSWLLMLRSWCNSVFYVSLISQICYVKPETIKFLDVS